MSQKGLKVEFHLYSERQAKEPPPAPVKDPVPRIARLLALAHKWEGMVRRGEVKDYAEIARQMGLSRARVTQVCGLVLLSPELQNRLLESSPPLLEQQLRAIVQIPLWERQLALQIPIHLGVGNRDTHKPQCRFSSSSETTLAGK